MTLRLSFNPGMIPRTTTRDEWRAMWRWKRETEKALRREHDQRVQNIVAYGNTHPEIFKSLADDIVNPPLMVRAWPDEKVN